MSQSSEPRPSGTPARALVVQVGSERHALALSLVHEVVSGARVTEVPRAPVGVAGVICVHGAIVTVVDVARVLGLDAPPADDSPIVLVDVRGECVGLRVDRVVRVGAEGREGAALPEALDPAWLFERIGGQSPGGDGRLP